MFVYKILLKPSLKRQNTSLENLAARVKAAKNNAQTIRNLCFIGKLSQAPGTRTIASCLCYRGLLKEAVYSVVLEDKWNKHHLSILPSLAVSIKHVNALNVYFWLMFCSSAGSRNYLVPFRWGKFSFKLRYVLSEASSNSAPKKHLLKTEVQLHTKKVFFSQLKNKISKDKCVTSLPTQYSAAFTC